MWRICALWSSTRLIGWRWDNAEGIDQVGDGAYGALDDGDGDSGLSFGSA